MKLHVKLSSVTAIRLVDYQKTLMPDEIRESGAHRKKCAEKRGSHAEQYAMTYCIMIIWSKFVKKLTSF
jgi:hypothetical protein